MSPRRLTALALACVAAAGAGCQWVLPLHQEDEATFRDGAAPGGEGGAVDATTPDAIVSSDGAVTDGTPRPDTGCSTPWTYYPPCDDCLNRNCCEELTRCFVTNAECKALGDCIGKCGFDFITCPQNCAAAHDGGIDDYNRANACSTNRCTPDCKTPNDAGAG